VTGYVGKREADENILEDIIPVCIPLTHISTNFPTINTATQLIFNHFPLISEPTRSLKNFSKPQNQSRVFPLNAGNKITYKIP
jgi:hypothetical protein